MTYSSRRRDGVQLEELRSQATGLWEDKAAPAVASATQAASDMAGSAQRQARSLLDYLPTLLDYAGPALGLWRSLQDRSRDVGQQASETIQRQRQAVEDALDDGLATKLRPYVIGAAVVVAFYGAYRLSRVARPAKPGMRSRYPG